MAWRRNLQVSSVGTSAERLGVGADHDGGRAAGAKGAATEETRKGLRLRILPGTGCHRAGPPSKSGARAGGGRSDDFTQSNCGGTEAELATSATTCLHPQPPSRAYICVRNLIDWGVDCLPKLINDGDSRIAKRGRERSRLCLACTISKLGPEHCNNRKRRYLGSVVRRIDYSTRRNDLRRTQNGPAKKSGNKRNVFHNRSPCGFEHCLAHPRLGYPAQRILSIRFYFVWRAQRGAQREPEGTEPELRWVTRGVTDFPELYCPSFQQLDPPPTPEPPPTRASLIAETTGADRSPDQQRPFPAQAVSMLLSENM